MIIIFESELQENINDTILKKYKNLIKKLSIDNRVYVSVKIMRMENIILKNVAITILDTH